MGFISWTPSASASRPLSILMKGTMPFAMSAAGTGLAVNHTVHRPLEQDRANHLVAVERRRADNPAAHLVDEPEHLLIARIGAFLNAIAPSAPWAWSPPLWSSAAMKPRLEPFSRVTLGMLHYHVSCTEPGQHPLPRKPGSGEKANGYSAFPRRIASQSTIVAEFHLKPALSVPRGEAKLGILTRILGLLGLLVTPVSSDCRRAQDRQTSARLHTHAGERREGVAGGPQGAVSWCSTSGRPGASRVARNYRCSTATIARCKARASPSTRSRPRTPVPLKDMKHRFRGDGHPVSPPGEKVHIAPRAVCRRTS